MVNYHLKGHLFQLVLVGSPRCNRCKQASETASHIVCHCEVPVVLRCRHLDHHSLKPGDFIDISLSKIMHAVQSSRLLTA